MNNGRAGSGIGLIDQQRLRGTPLAVIDDVRTIIAKSLNIPIERLTPDSRLDELGAESLDVIEIVFGLEEKFDITIPLKADEATRLRTGITAFRTRPARRCRFPPSAMSPTSWKNWSRRKYAQ